MGLDGDDETDTVVQRPKPAVDPGSPEPLVQSPKPAVDSDGTEPLVSSSAELPTLPLRFERLGVLGRGGMGEVLRVHDRSLNREVAVKLLTHLDSASLRQRFLREARAVGTLHHPNIVMVHDIAPGGEYLVMELIEGESLAQKVRRDGKLPLEEVYQIGAALLGALAAAHREGIVHRDVKPANVLIDRDGAVKLTDFGIASFGDSELTSTGQLVGTPAYMAPEQLRARRVDQRADVYGAGATLFEAATGTRLNDDKGRVEDPYQAVLDASGDAALAAAITRAVREKEIERFCDAGAFADALAQREPGQVPVRRWRLTAGLELAALVAAIGVLVVVAVTPTEGVAVPERQRDSTIAMLPFENRSGDARLDFATSGLPHQLGKQLGQLDRVRVLGYYRVRGRLADPNAPRSAWLDAARVLGADVIVRGTLDPAAELVRVTIVVERSDGTVIDRIDRAVAVDQVPEAVQALAPSIASAALGTSAVVEPATARSFELERELQLGIAAAERMDLEAASRHLTAAVVRDDSLAEAHYYLAIIEWWRAGPYDKHLERALASPLPATERDFLIGLRMLVRQEYPRNIEYFEELARRAPAHREVQYGLFEALFHGGDPGDAMVVYRRLRDVAPHFHVGIEHAKEYYLTRGDTKGLAWLGETWEPLRNQRSAWTARVMMAQRRYPDAIRTLERAAEEEPNTGVHDGRLLVEAYAVIGQLALAREANDRLTADPNYQAFARYGLAIAGGDPTSDRDQAVRALPKISIKPWLAELDLVALELPTASRARLGELAERFNLDQNATKNAGVILLALARRDHEQIAVARKSHFPQVAALAEAAAADLRSDPIAASAGWRRALELNSDGRMQLYTWYSLARNARTRGDHAGVIAACDEVIVPRVFMWSWASLVGPCLRWSAESAAALGHADDSRRRWQQLLALRSSAPAGDELVSAARTALGR